MVVQRFRGASSLYHAQSPTSVMKTIEWSKLCKILPISYDGQGKGQETADALLLLLKFTILLKFVKTFNNCLSVIPLHTGTLLYLFPPVTLHTFNGAQALQACTIQDLFDVLFWSVWATDKSSRNLLMFLSQERLIIICQFFAKVGSKILNILSLVQNPTKGSELYGDGFARRTQCLKWEEFQPDNIILWTRVAAIPSISTVFEIWTCQINLFTRQRRG